MRCFVPSLVVSLACGVAYAGVEQAPSPLSTPAPTLEYHSVNRIEHAPPSCIRLAYKVNAQGIPEDLRVWSYYPTPVFRKMATSGLLHWTFKPATVNGRPIDSDWLFQDFVYGLTEASIVRIFNKIADSAAMGLDPVGGLAGLKSNEITPSTATLHWICQQPITHGVRVVYAKPPDTEASATESAGEMDPIVAVGHSDALDALAGKAVVVHFCVDDKGRISNTVLHSPVKAMESLSFARLLLERVRFSVLKIGGKAEMLCGLKARINFFGNTKGAAGEVKLVKYSSRDNGPQPPAFKSEKPVRLSLHIPPGTKLPKVAKVDLRFCIGKNGEVEDPKVVDANPAKYFDNAAIETARNWTFARSDHRICDVYQSVEFPLGGR